jgi:hypothetical protein
MFLRTGRDADLIRRTMIGEIRGIDGERLPLPPPDRVTGREPFGDVGMAAAV